MVISASPRTTTAQGAETARRVAAAAVAVAARGGFDGLSVRTVAAEAGVAIGTVQHHYPTRSALLLAAFDHTVQTIAARVTAADFHGPVHLVLERVLAQGLPLDATRESECVVWVAFSAAAASHPELREPHRLALDAVTELVVALIARGQECREVSSAVDPAAAAAVLLAAVDGLTMHGVAGSRHGDTLIGTLRATIDALVPPPVRPARHERVRTA